MFADHRTRTTPKFCEIDPQRIIAALKLTREPDVTPKGDIAENKEGVKALEKAILRPRKSFKLPDAALKIGDTINYENNEKIIAQVVSEKKILFEGEETSLSKSALKLLQRDRYTWQTVKGWQNWSFERETIAEGLERLLNDANLATMDNEE